MTMDMNIWEWRGEYMNLTFPNGPVRGVEYQFEKYHIWVNVGIWQDKDA